MTTDKLSDEREAMTEDTGFIPDNDQAAAALAEVLKPATPETIDKAAGECCGGSCDPAHSTGTDKPDITGEQDGRRLHRRSMPDRLRYLASQLASANVRPDTIANALEVTADELAGQVTVSREDPEDLEDLQAAVKVLRRVTEIEADRHAMSAAVEAAAPAVARNALLAFAADLDSIGYTRAADLAREAAAAPGAAL